MVKTKHHITNGVRAIGGYFINKPDDITTVKIPTHIADGVYQITPIQSKLYLKQEYHENKDESFSFPWSEVFFQSTMPVIVNIDKKIPVLDGVMLDSNGQFIVCSKSLIIFNDKMTCMGGMKYYSAETHRFIRDHGTSMIYNMDDSEYTYVTSQGGEMRVEKDHTKQRLEQLVFSVLFSQDRSTPAFVTTPVTFSTTTTAYRKYVPVHDMNCFVSNQQNGCICCADEFYIDDDVFKLIKPLCKGGKNIEWFQFEHGAVNTVYAKVNDVYILLTVMRKDFLNE